MFLGLQLSTFIHTEVGLLVSLKTKSLALSGAESVARSMLDLPEVYDVFLFGSVSRNGDGNDIDLIVTVDEYLVDVFLREMWLLAHEFLDDPYVHKYQRLDAAGTTLAGEWSSYFDIEPELDVFLFPRDWMDRLPELQLRFSNRDPHFMANIARDARRYDPEHLRFEGLRF